MCTHINVEYPLAIYAMCLNLSCARGRNRTNFQKHKQLIIQSCESNLFDLIVRAMHGKNRTRLHAGPKTMLHKQFPLCFFHPTPKYVVYMRISQGRTVNGAE